jgi:hypothetical protein
VLDNGHVVAAGTVEDVLGPGLSGTVPPPGLIVTAGLPRLMQLTTSPKFASGRHDLLTGRAGSIGREARVARATDITLARRAKTRAYHACRHNRRHRGRRHALAGVSIDLDGTPSFRIGNAQGHR